MFFYFSYVDLLKLLHLQFPSHDIVHQIIEVGPVDKPLPLVTSIHGGPAKLVVTVLLVLALHEAPERTSHDGHWLLIWHYQDFTDFINLHSLAEELT